MIKIEVTEEDIKDGVRENVKQCPVARAVLRQLDFAEVVEVSMGGIDINFDVPGRKFIRYKIPKKVMRFIQRFDEGKSVKPFSFVLREGR